ncbi:ABC transporter ATP-binding protein [Blautia sp. TF11-31AT]|jgi:ABC-type polysaccharide/polyol phosphate transport system ATPase subunit|nr:ABC transporter ATP-binding protein [Blautia sp. TF11-31AT]
MADIAISVNNVSKMYKLYDNPMDRLKESLGLTRQKKYKEHYALHDVSFQVERGECVGIIGTNGSGKSTILKIITGVLNQTQGEVVVNGRISALLELGAGFNMEYTGIENVYLNGTMIGFTKEEIDAKLQAILDFADIGDFVYQPVKTYSSGMFVRLAFAVAINIEPEILIVDEALSVGDVFFQAKCYRKFEEFKKMGKTILMVSHDLSSISKYCDKVILLNHGVKMDEGEPKEIVDLYKKVLVGQAGEDAGQAEAVIEVAEENQEKKNLETADKWVRPFQMNPQLLEYGDKRVKIRDFTIQDAKGNYTNTIEKNTTFKILVSIQFETKVQEPIVAYTFKNVHGTEITGTNTMYEKMDIRPCEEGEEVIITFTQKMNLQGGEYLLSLGCTGYQDGSFTVFHRLYDVCNITVVSNKNTVGFYDMNSEITVEYR